MRRASCLVQPPAAKNLRAELFLGALEAALPAAVGVTLLLIPLLRVRGPAVLTLGWLLLFVMALCVLRPLFFRRGFPDLVAGMIRGLYYTAAALCTNSLTLLGPVQFKFFLSLLLIFCTLSQIILFARLYDSAFLPLLPVCALCNFVVALLLLAAGLPPQLYYWLLGMLALLDAGEHLSELRLIVHQRRHRRE